MPPYNPDDYEPVEDRIRSFWADHPNGQIITELVQTDEKRFIVKAIVSKERESEAFGTHLAAIASGYAEEIVGAGPVNRTHALENCETSAIGRALANAGYATKGKRPSREEMQKEQRQQPRAIPAAAVDEHQLALEKAASEARDVLRNLCQNMNLDLRAVANEYARMHGQKLADSDSARQIRDFTEHIRKREEADADPEAAQG